MKKKKRQTETHQVIVKTGDKVGIYLDGKRIATSTPIQIHTVELDKN